MPRKERFQFLLLYLSFMNKGNGIFDLIPPGFISRTVGFHDKSRFICCFRKTHGMTPDACRRQYRNEK